MIARTASSPPHPELNTMVPLRLLRLVSAVAEHRSASAAAQALHQSVSAVTRSVRQAEELMGLPLFERGARGMVLTPAGRVIAARVRRALDELRRGAHASFSSQATDGMLHALSAVAATRSESGAAERLGLTQPAVHSTLMRIEHAARARIFERSKRGTHLTQAGELLLQHARLALAELRIGHDELSAFRGMAAGRVAVGALPMSCEVLVQQALNRLFSARPEVQATVMDGTYEALIHQLRHGDLDLVVGPLRGARAASDILEEMLFEDRLVPVVRRGNSRLGRPWPDSLRAVQAWPWIGPLPGTPARAAFEQAFATEGVPVPRVALQTSSPAVLRAVLMGGDHIALVSPLQVRAELASGLLQALPISVSGTERAIGLTLRRSGLPPPACLALMDEIRFVAKALRVAS